VERKKFIYFDIGGTLLDYSKVFETPSKGFNLKVGDIDKVFSDNHVLITKGRMTPQQFWEECVKRYDLKNALDYNFLDAWVSDYRPINELHNLVYSIQTKYRLGLMSNIYVGMLPVLLKKKIIPDVFYDQIVFSCDVGMMKPDPNIFVLAMKRANVAKKDLLLIDDDEKNVEQAKALGWNTFHFDNQNSIHSVKKLTEYLENFA
jgi:epoxide hydrolase-like predicted phosphatase